MKNSLGPGANVDSDQNRAKKQHVREATLSEEIQTSAVQREPFLAAESPSRFARRLTIA